MLLVDIAKVVPRYGDHDMQLPLPDIECGDHGEVHVSLSSLFNALRDSR
ncbi:hypothetical protein T261_06035 [Streptomyces lydicus]|nr:hypothetical protein T261_06035 [Streptomyces lydicus]